MLIANTTWWRVCIVSICFCMASRKTTASHRVWFRAMAFWCIFCPLSLRILKDSAYFMLYVTHSLTLRPSLLSSASVTWSGPVWVLLAPAGALHHRQVDGTILTGVIFPHLKLIWQNLLLLNWLKSKCAAHGSFHFVDGVPIPSLFDNAPLTWRVSAVLQSALSTVSSGVMPSRTPSSLLFIVAEYQFDAVYPYLPIRYCPSSMLAFYLEPCKAPLSKLLQLLLLETCRQ